MYYIKPLSKYAHVCEPISSNTAFFKTYSRILKDYSCNTGLWVFKVSWNKDGSIYSFNSRCIIIINPISKCIHLLQGEVCRDNLIYQNNKVIPMNVIKKFIEAYSEQFIYSTSKQANGLKMI